VLVRLPFHAVWLNEIEIVFSVIQRRVLTPDDVTGLQAVVDRLDAFEHHTRSPSRSSGTSPEPTSPT
jgi:hypothetical protein